MIPEQKEISLPALFCSMLLQRARDFVTWIFFHAGRPYRPEKPLPKAIMDMHCHVGGIGAGGSG